MTNLGFSGVLVLDWEADREAVQGSIRGSNGLIAYMYGHC